MIGAARDAIQDRLARAYTDITIELRGESFRQSANALPREPNS